MYMKFSRKKIDKIIKMKNQTAKLRRKNKVMKIKRTLRKRRLNLKKRTMKGGDSQQVQSLVNRSKDKIKETISTFKENIKLYKDEQKKLIDQVSKLEADQKTPETEKLIKKYKMRAVQLKKNIANLNNMISNLDNYKNALNYGVLNKKMIDTIKLFNKTIDVLKSVDNYDNILDSVCDENCQKEKNGPQVITTVIKTLKGDDGKIIPPGYVVNVIKNPEGINAMTAAAVLSKAAQSVRSSPKVDLEDDDRVPPVKLPKSEDTASAPVRTNISSATSLPKPTNKPKMSTLEKIMARKNAQLSEPTPREPPKPILKPNLPKPTNIKSMPVIKKPKVTFASPPKPNIPPGSFGKPIQFESDNEKDDDDELTQQQKEAREIANTPILKLSKINQIKKRKAKNPKSKSESAKDKKKGNEKDKKKPKSKSESAKDKKKGNEKDKKKPKSKSESSKDKKKEKEEDKKVELTESQKKIVGILKNMDRRKLKKILYALNHRNLKEDDNTELKKLIINTYINNDVDVIKTKLNRIKDFKVNKSDQKNKVFVRFINFVKQQKLTQKNKKQKAVQKGKTQNKQQKAVQKGKNNKN